ncbi:MAG: GDSL-type esterase/lipase family protein [Planctomycetaceae bacterium]|jgi:lysophospholipase L1-like esterase|nr:GDSL-type esterase/lipase family protein [Planctomycetaceae bacterium]
MTKRKYHRIIFWVALPCCLVLFAGGVYWFRFARPVGSRPVGIRVSQPAFQQIWSERKILLLGMGDSITAGFGMDKGYGYVDWILDNPPDEYSDMQGICLRKVLPNIRVENIAVSGSTSIQHAEYVETKLEIQSEDVFGLIVWTTGGNDLIHFYGQRPPKEGAMYGASLEQAKPWIDNFRNRLDEMIEKTKRKFPGGCAIFLADIYDPSDGVGDPASAFLPPWADCLAILGEYNTALRTAAEKHNHVYHVPLHAAFLGHGTHCTQIWRKNYCWSDPAYWYGDNLEDPNKRGFDAIRRIFLIEIAKQRTVFTDEN